MLRSKSGDARMARKLSDTVRLNLRITEALRARLQKHADKNQQSLNEEIVRRIENSFKGDDVEEFLQQMAETTGRPVTLKVGDAVKVLKPHSEESK
jgi:16S rRNA C967 or C1407 C5-methylase (RsmB/RsmF family)